MAQIPTVDRMRIEHRRFLATLGALEESTEAGSSRALHAPKLRALLGHCARQFAGHVELEHRSIFPRLESALFEARLAIEPLRQEHEDLEAMIGSLSRLLEEPQSAWRDEQVGVQVHDLVVLLRLHVQREEDFLRGVGALAIPSEGERRAARSPGRAPKAKPRRAPSHSRGERRAK
jgi:hypothetical protein